jgi:N-acetylmuramoyl-L-alanine amidase
MLFLLLGLLLLAFASGAFAKTAASSVVSVPTKQGRRAVIEGDLYLRVPVPRKGGLRAVAARYTGDPGDDELIAKANPARRGKRLSEARIPFDLLSQPYADEVIGALFPKDRRSENGWDHYWTRGSWSDLARWFSRDAKSGPNLKEANRKVRRLRQGERIFIPYGLLGEAFRHFGQKAEEEQAPPPKPAAEEPKPKPEAAPPETATPPRPPAATEQAPPDAVRSLLSYGQDKEGRYAIYKLQAKEALYSAVVVRFTGNVDAADVNALAMQIAKRSGISDVTAIPVGFPVKIPLDNLLPQYLPQDDSRYQAWLQNQDETAAVRNPIRSEALDGVVVILDAGHGGLDRGAVKNGVWEDSYVYDIVCRIHEGLEKRTKARVLLTLMDPSLGLKPQDKEGLTPNTGAVILTHPWFHQESTSETKVEVNLRWYLANQYYERLVKEGLDPGRIVFTSVHADSLHPSLRGSMFYVPGTPYRSTKWSQAGGAYARYTEYKAKPVYELSEKELIRSEGLSRQFARKLEEAFASKELPLHPYNPTRDHVVRGRRPWVPAVLRNAETPCSVLLEVCNIANKKDAELLRDPRYRQAVAEAYIDALIRYYS